MQCNLRTLFTRPPCSEAELFRKVKQCVSIFEPERLQNLKPAPEEDIQALEQMIMERYGCSIPASYKLYLQEMGQEDGGILSKRMDYRLEEWNGFKRGNMARGAKNHLMWESFLQI